MFVRHPARQTGWLMLSSRFQTFGLDVVALIFIPSYLVYTQHIDGAWISRIKTVVSGTPVIEVYISLLILGSIFSIERHSMVERIGLMVIPVMAASIAAVIAGVGSGIIFGLSWSEAFFMVVVPVMSGGVSAGALPLSVGYGAAFGSASGDMFAHLLPPVIIGNAAALVCAGILNAIDKIPIRQQDVQEASPASANAARAEISRHRHWVVVYAFVWIVIFVFAAEVISRLSSINVPLVALLLAAALHWFDFPAASLREAIVAIYRICIKVCTYPILVLVGLLYTPWETLSAGFSPARILTIMMAVATMAIVGYRVSQWSTLRPVEGGIVSLCRAAMGGTGDVIILGAAGRLDLMPFAQIATRIGGAATVLAALTAAEFVGK